MIAHQSTDKRYATVFKNKITSIMFRDSYLTVSAKTRKKCAFSRGYSALNGLILNGVAHKTYRPISSKNEKKKTEQNKAKQNKTETKTASYSFLILAQNV